MAAIIPMTTIPINPYFTYLFIIAYLISLFICVDYSSLNASMGLIFTALLAGKSPMSTLSPTINKNEMMNWGMLIMGFTNGKSSPLPHMEFMMDNIPTEMAKPTSPANAVNTMASNTIWRLTILGVAPSALLTPISWVLSFTVIKRILLMAITPAKSVKMPTKNENPWSTVVNALILLNISDISKLPMARSSFGWISYFAFRISLICLSTTATFVS